MSENAFIGRREPPVEAELAAALGRSKRLWDDLLSRLADEHGLTTSEWNSYSPKAGWALRVKQRKRNIVYLAPHKDGFSASLALGDKALQAAREAGLPARILKLMDEARRYAEGTAVRLDVDNAKDVEIVSKLVKAKLAS